MAFEPGTRRGRALGGLEIRAGRNLPRPAPDDCPSAALTLEGHLADDRPCFLAVVPCFAIAGETPE